MGPNAWTDDYGLSDKDIYEGYTSSLISICFAFIYLQGDA